MRNGNTLNGKVVPALAMLAAGAIFGIAGQTLANEQTVGLFVDESGASGGYTLFTPLTHPTTYLIDRRGRLVNSWTSQYSPGNTHFFRPNGNLVRSGDPGNNDVIAAGGDAGIVEEYDWDGNLLWSYLYSDDTVRAHHDIALLPNGNVLILAWELKTTAESIQAGRDPALISQDAIWPEHVIEVEPDGPTGGTIVWEWHFWDHLVQDLDAGKDNFGVVADHPELLDVNYANNGNADWLHANRLEYNAELDQILVNSPFLGEFWIIDHSTTTKEAAGHTGGNSGMGGDILYRWGNPQVYDRGTNDDRKFWHHHGTNWVPPGLPGAGNIIVFNNGNGRPEGAFTTIDELVTPVNGFNYDLDPGEAYGPDSATVVYIGDPPEDFYGAFLSGVERLPSGNSLICNGPWGTIFEVTPGGETVWKYINPVLTSGPMVQGDAIPPQGATSNQNRCFHAPRYQPDFVGFKGKDLTPGDVLELYPCPGDVDCDGSSGFSDTLAILSNWGPCGVCPEDIDHDGNVGFNDLLLHLANYGPCP